MKHILISIPDAGEVDPWHVFSTLFPALARDCVRITDEHPKTVLHHRTGVQVSVHDELPSV